MNRAVLKVLYWIVFSLLILFLIGTTIVVFNSDHKVEGFKTHKLFKLSAALNEAVDAILYPPVQNVEILNAADTCPSGYLKANLGIWPSLARGCLCEDTGFITRGDCPATCSKKQPISRSEPFPISRWRSKAICILHYKSKILYQQKSCPAGYLACLNQGLCIDRNGENPPTTCPINKIQLIGEDNLQFFYDESVKADPIVNFEISSSGIPCIIPSSFPKRANPYPLSNAVGCEDGGYGDLNNFIIPLDKYNEKSLLKENKALDILTQKGQLTTALDTAISKESVFLFGRKKIYVLDEVNCKQIYAMDDDDLERIGSNLRFYLIVLVGLLAILVLGGLLVWRRNNWKIRCNRDNVVYVIAIIIFCPIFVTGLWKNSVLIHFYYKKFVPFEKTLESYKGQHCLDSRYNVYQKIVEEVYTSPEKEILRSLFTMPFINGIVFGLMFFLWIVYGCLARNARKDSDEIKFLEDTEPKKGYEIPRL